MYHFKRYILVLLTLLLNGCSPATSEQQPAQYYQAARIISIIPSENYTVARKYVGQLIATQQTELSFEYGGRVKEILVDSGETVSAGQSIAKLDTELLTINKRQLVAKIKQINAQLELNKTNLERVNSLVHSSYASRQRLDELTAEKEMLSAQVDELNASLAIVHYQIDKSQLVAPYDGTLSQRYISEGELINAGKAAFKLLKQSQQEIRVGVPYNIASQLHINQILPVTLNQQSIQAPIISIGDEVNPTTRTVQLRLAIPTHANSESGSLVTVNITDIKKQRGYWIPIAALTDGMRGMWNIYQAQSTPDGNYEIRAQIVSVEHTTAEQAFITADLDGELSIISTGLHRYVPGQLVRQAPTLTQHQAQQP